MALPHSYAVFRFGAQIPKLGVVATLEQKTDSFDPTTGQSSGVTWTSYPISPLVSDITDLFDAKEYTETTVLEVVVAQRDLGNIVPAQGDRVIISGQTYRVLKVGPGFIGDVTPSYIITAQA